MCVRNISKELCELYENLPLFREMIYDDILLLSLSIRDISWNYALLAPCRHGSMQEMLLTGFNGREKDFFQQPWDEEN